MRIPIERLSDEALRKAAEVMLVEAGTGRTEVVAGFDRVKRARPGSRLEVEVEDLEPALLALRRRIVAPRPAPPSGVERAGQVLGIVLVGVLFAGSLALAWVRSRHRPRP